MYEVALRVDDVGGSQGNPSVLILLGVDEAPVISRDILCQVTEEWELQRTNASLFQGGHAPLPVDEVRVDRTSKDLTIGLLEVKGFHKAITVFQIPMDSLGFLQ